MSLKLKSFFSYDFNEFIPEQSTTLKLKNENVISNYKLFTCIEKLYCIDEALVCFFQETKTTWDNYSLIALSELKENFAGRFTEFYNFKAPPVVEIPNEDILSLRPSLKTEHTLSKVLAIQIEANLIVKLGIWEK